jgi:aromatic ring-cleaving dioxygenase
MKRVKGCRSGSARTSREILDELAKKVVELEGLRDSEWDFCDKHGYDSSFWDAEAREEHDEILADIKNHRDAVSLLVREATGDDKVSV